MVYHHIAVGVVALVVITAGGLAAVNMGVIPSDQTPDGIEQLAEDAGALTSGFSSSGGVSDGIEQVPDGVDTVQRVDGDLFEDSVVHELYAEGHSQILEFATSEAATNTSTAEFEEYSNLTSVLDEFQNQTDLDLRDVDEVVNFAKETNFSEPAYQATIIHAGWDEETVREQFANSSYTTYQNDTINGTTVYRPVEDETTYVTGSWLAVLDDGEYAIGSEQAVRDVIAVDNGDEAALDGDLRDAYANTRDGLVRQATKAPNVNMTAINETTNPDAGLNVTAYAEEYNSLYISSSSLYTTNDGIGSVQRVQTNTTSAAKDVESLYRGFKEVQAGAIENETLEEHLRSTTVNRNGKTVVVKEEMTVDEAGAILEWILSLSESPIATDMQAGGSDAVYA